MRKLIAVALVAFVLPALAYGKTLSLGADAPVITVDVPDEWNANEYPNGVAVTAPGNFLVTVEVVPVAEIASKMEAAMKYFVDKGVEIDKNSVVSNEMKINDYDVTYTAWRGQDKDGPAIVTISGLVLNDEQIIQINTWGSEESDKANSDAVLALVNSIKPAQ